MADTITKEIIALESGTIVSTTWYGTSTFGDRITPVRVAKITEHTLTFIDFATGYKPLRVNKHSSTENFYPTWELAHIAILSKLERDLAWKERTLLELRERIVKVKAQSPPDTL